MNSNNSHLASCQFVFSAKILIQFPSTGSHFSSILHPVEAPLQKKLCLAIGFLTNDLLEKSDYTKRLLADKRNAGAAIIIGQNKFVVNKAEFQALSVILFI